jgi:phosphomannomutase
LIEAARKQADEEIGMAVEGDADKELIVHRRGYESFISLFRIAAAICLVAALIIILIIRT